VNTLRILWPRWLWLLPAIFALNSAWAVDPSWLLSQYAHTSWKTVDGALVGSPATIAQTTDGYLWIGTTLGLVRFDGARFVPWNPPPGQRLLDSRIFSLLGSRDGSLWIGTGYSLSRWKDGQLTNYPQLSGRIEALLEDAAGTIWLGRTQATDQMGPLCQIQSLQLQCFGTDEVPFPNILQLARGNDGAIWLGGYPELCLWRPGRSRIYFRNRSGFEGFSSFKALDTGPDGSTWAAIDSPGPVLRLQHFVDGRWREQRFPDIPVRNSQVTALFVDRNNQLWIGTRERGVFRVKRDRVEHFDRTDGLSSDFVRSFYQDHEGTIWIVTSAGLDNLRDLHVATYSMRQGLAADGAGSVLASHDSGLWVLENNEIVQKLQNGRFSLFLPRPGVPGHHLSTFFEDHAGRLWFGIENGLFVDDHGEFRPILHADGTPLGIVFSITEDTAHGIWVRAGPNLDRIQDFKIQAELTSTQIRTAYILAAAPDGGIVLGLVDGELVRYRNGEMRSVASSETGNTSQIRDMTVDPDGTVWGTTVNELFALRGLKRENLTARNGLPCDGIFALVQDDAHAIWLYSKCGLIRIARSELDNWWQQPSSFIHTTLLDQADGVQPGLTSLKPQTARTADGRLWFANGRVLQSIDPAHLAENPIPPPVQVESVVADGNTHLPRQGLRLPPRTRDLEIAYTALSYVAPQKVRFRYRLEGRDAGWQEPGTRRQAFYTDLGPGRYTFHVIARNNDGVWNDTGARLSFSIAPAWYQTVWFELACALFVLVVAWALYQLRIRQIAAAMNARFDERLDERTRLAREFHDTLLQTIQGSKMVADDALDESADPARMHHALERLSVWLGQATQEGRAALHSLRVSTTQRNDLAEAFRRATESDRIPGSMSVAVSVVGVPGEMHPVVRDEICRIGYEAIRNASLHSQADRLDVELSYAQDLTLRVKDNGVGIDPLVLDTGKDGHFGLQGMRERTARIGGRLTLLSSAASGTEIKLVVPGNIIFRAPRSARWTLLARIRSFFLGTNHSSNTG